MTPPPALPPCTLVRRAEAVAERPRGDSIVVLALDAPRCNPFELTGGGVELWGLLDREPSEISSLVARIATEHGTEETEIDHPIRTFLTQLLENGLIEVVDRG